MSLSKKIDFAVVFNVKNANPNGDPLNGNRPRITLDSHGELSDVCLKRKIRNRLIELGHSVFVQSDDIRTDEYKSLRERAEAVLPSKGTKDELSKLACEKWFDVRSFGQVFAFSGDKKGEGISIGIRGPVTVQPAFSIEPVEITSTQITKSVNSEPSKKSEDGMSSDRMGMKHRVDYGIYTFFGSINPLLAAKTGFSDEDANVVKAILPKLFENDASSARPEGSMNVMKVVWWEHSSKSGVASSAKVHGSLKVAKDGSIEFTDLSSPKPEIIDGF